MSLINQLPLEPGERIIQVCRKHWYVYVLEGLILFVLFILPYVAFRLLGITISTDLNNLSVKMRDLITLFYTGWFLLLWIYFFIAWTNVYLDAWIITDRRIIDIEQQSLFHRSVSDFRIEKIQNITVREMGLIANMMGYGSIHVETAGEREELRFDSIPHPYKIRDLISECHDKCLARLESSGSSAKVKDLITED